MIFYFIFFNTIPGSSLAPEFYYFMYVLYNGHASVRYVCRHRCGCIPLVTMERGSFLSDYHLRGQAWRSFVLTTCMSHLDSVEITLYVLRKRVLHGMLPNPGQQVSLLCLRPSVRFSPVPDLLVAFNEDDLLTLFLRNKLGIATDIKVSWIGQYFIKRRCGTTL